MMSATDGKIYMKLGPKGIRGTYDHAWDDGCGGDVKHICICHHEVIHSIQTTYQRQGIAYISERHGGAEGNFDVISFNEPLTWVSGHYGSWCIDPDLFYIDEEEDPGSYMKVIRSLKFGTDRAIYGPFGKEVGEPFHYKSSTDISGFHGHCSSSERYRYLTTLGVYVGGIAVCPISDDPIQTMAKTELAVVSSSLQDEAKSSEKLLTKI